MPAPTPFHWRTIITPLLWLVAATILTPLWSLDFVFWHVIVGSVMFFYVFRYFQDSALEWIAFLAVLAALACLAFAFFVADAHGISINELQQASGISRRQRRLPGFAAGCLWAAVLAGLIVPIFRRRFPRRGEFD